jgi:hypothetical protein
MGRQCVVIQSSLAGVFMINLPVQIFMSWWKILNTAYYSHFKLNKKAASEVSNQNTVMPHQA